MSNIYCTYLTIYSGNKLPPFYIGSSSVKNVNSGYHGSVRSKKYKAIWLDELKNNPDLFETKIISQHDTGVAAREKELKLQKTLKVVESPLYINQSYATVNGFFGVIIKGKDNPRYGIPHTEESRKKISENHHDVSGKNNPNYGRIGADHPNAVKFWAIDPNGVKYIAKGINQFAILHNLGMTNISMVLTGRAKTHKKWTFGYI